ncbi:hypothetical protein LTR56_026984 [Elasticomyces elasticus]|nr:hypothetical protein LTR56_026984 [Elasticomyces elasticus]
MAATTTPEIFNQVFAAGADDSFWKLHKIPDSLPEEEHLTPSQLSTSTSVEYASGARQCMLRSLWALTPLQYAVQMGDSKAVAILMAHPDLNLSVRTPVFGVHALHFVVARLDLPSLQSFDTVPLASVPPRNLVHTLLHITCLPLEGNSIQVFADKVW